LLLLLLFQFLKKIFFIFTNAHNFTKVTTIILLLQFKKIVYFHKYTQFYQSYNNYVIIIIIAILKKYMFICIVPYNVITKHKPTKCTFSE